MTTFANGLAQRSAAGVIYLEIEGLPYAYGNIDKDSTWFDVSGQAFEGIKPWLKVGSDAGDYLPSITGQRANFLDGRVSMGSLRIAIADMDGSLAALTATRREDSRARVSSTSITYNATSFNGSAPSWSGWDTTAGTIYCDLETMTGDLNTGTGAFTNVTRGKYRSIAKRHNGTDAVVEGKNPALLTPYARNLIGRRCWLKWGMDAASDNDTTTLFAGTVAELSWEGGGRTLVLSCDDAQSWLRRAIFTDIGGAGEITPIGGAAPVIDSVAYDSSVSKVRIKLGGARETGVTTNASVQVAIEAEAFADQTFTITRDGSSTTDFLLSTSDGIVASSSAAVTFASNAIGAKVLEVALMQDDVLLGVHPLTLLLRIVTSTGDGSNGGFDTLTAEQGLGIPQADVDVAGIRALIHKNPRDRVNLRITEAIPDAREFLVRELRPFGYYLRVGSSYAISAGHLSQVTPDDIADATTLSIDDFAVDKEGAFVRLDGPKQSSELIAGLVELHAAPELVGGKQRLKDLGKMGAVLSDEYLGIYLDAPVVKIESYGLHEPQAQEVAQRLVPVLQQRFGHPPNILTVGLWIESATILPGDLVSLTLADLPSVSTSTRGIDSEIFEVWSRDVDLKSGVVTLELAQTGVGILRKRYLAPAAVLASISPWADDTPSAGNGTITIMDNLFTESGVAHDTTAFTVGDKIRVYTEDLVTRSAVAEITALTNTTIVIDADQGELGLTPASGYVVMLADYDDTGMPARLTSRYAFRASNAALLSTADEPHVYS